MVVGLGKGELLEMLLGNKYLREPPIQSFEGYIFWELLELL
jgi:hypothetical protein